MAEEKQPEVKSYPDTPEGWAARLKLELDSALKEPKFKEWRDRGDKIDARFRDERDEKTIKRRLNLFPSNVQTQRAITYGKIPQVSVDRKFSDAQDDAGRVAGILTERHLNCDIDRDDDTQKEAFGYALQDLELPGLGVVRVRYDMQEEEVPGQFQMDEAGQPLLDKKNQPIPLTRKAWEDAPVDWVHWKDFVWTKARVWHEVRMLFFRAELSREEMAEKFGEDVAALVPYEANKVPGEKAAEGPWQQCELYEVWVKKGKQVFFFVPGHTNVLTPKDLPADSVNPNGSVKDPLGLPGFWPCARPMLSNTSTSTLVPVPDFYLAQDLYLEVDTTTTKIDLLMEAVKVAGAYDGSAPAIEQILKTKGNILVPVENWNALAEKGGIAGAISWIPLDQVANALVQLRQHRQETMDLLFQVTGMSDLMRGQATTAGATAHEQTIKAKFGSVRLQSKQEEFARFISDTQKLRAQVIAKHFDPQTILKRANAEFLPDVDKALIPAALQVIKSKLDSYRIEVKPENVSLNDFSQLANESTQTLTAIATTMQAAAPLAQSAPEAMIFVAKAIQWSLSRIRGAKTLEGELDAIVKQMEEKIKNPPPQQQQPSPEQMKLQAVQMKGQMDIQKEQMKQQGDLQRIQAEVSADAQREQNQMQFNVREHAQKQIVSNALKPPAPPPKPGGFPR